MTIYLQLMGLEEKEHEREPVPEPAVLPPDHNPTKTYCFIGRIDGYRNRITLPYEYNPNMGKTERSLPGERVFADIGSLVEDLAKTDPDAARLVLALVERNLEGNARASLLYMLPAQDDLPSPIIAKGEWAVQEP